MKNHRQEAGWLLFIVVAIFIVCAVSNGANLTDGQDGLATGSSAIIGVALVILAYVSSNVRYASYLNIMYIPGSEELVVFMSAFIGATIGFLWYNSYPAQVFMGDTGSLMLGGIIAVCSIIIRKELLIPIFCCIFFIESLSVILQRYYFKFTKKRTGVGKRIFKMAPLHHHFQKPGNAGIEALIQKPLQAIPESKIVIRFWIIGLILAVLAIATLKMR
jgi:phospho-N-acetylmuramoyl-pentapeptide-transferase